ncbi:MAG: rod shape-determining protein MreD, partial [Pyrinomonadaceae bacterium]|nr:rod shape-determining protein MreD [Pyrinomonadaceae bacterium]
MEQVKTSLALVIAVLLQWSLREQIPPIAYVNFPLLVVVFVALNRESLKAMLFGSISGIAVDALSLGLLGAGGFSQTLTAFCVAELARRVLLLDNPLLRIPVIAGASLLNGILYYALHRLLGQRLDVPLLETL